jgi:hypothetical protein
VDTHGAVEVRPVLTSRDWRAFHAVRHAAYRDDPAAVLPLASEQRLQVDLERHPFWQHAAMQAFLCWSGGRAVGRIAAIVDRLHQRHYSDRTGFFGFFECENRREPAAALLRAAANWLNERGCDSMRGPVNPSLKGEFGVVVTGNEVPPTVMMTHTPPWYDSLLQDCGLRPAHDFFAFAIDWAGARDRSSHWQPLSQTCARILARHPELSVGCATRANLGATLRSINTLANRVRETVWGFVPTTDAELDFLVGRFRRIVIPELVIIVRRHGEIVGYMIAVPDVNWALARARGRYDVVRLAQLLFLRRKIPRLRIFAFGADPRFRRAGIVTLLVNAMFQAAFPRFNEIELSWISEANIASLRALQHALPLQPCKTYRVYQSALPWQ